MRAVADHDLATGWRRSLPNAIAEGMRTGLVPVATDAGARDLVGQGGVQAGDVRARRKRWKS
jgi:hypothetical protein